MYCKQCGKKIDDDSNFCTFCGTKISNDKTVFIEERKPFIAQDYVTTVPNVTLSKVSKYDENFQREDFFTTVGIVIIIVSFVASLVMKDQLEYMSLEDLKNIQVTGTIVSLVIRAVSVGMVSQYANKLNRDSVLWGLFAFLLPAVSMIIIGQKKKFLVKN